MTYLKAILVDFDGTLADTEQCNALAYQSALSHFNIKVDLAELINVIQAKHWSDFLPQLCAEEIIVADVAAYKHKIYPDFILDAPLNTRLVDMLKLLHSKISLALVTTASRSPVISFLEHYGILYLFAEIITSEDVAHSKPHPDTYIMAATKLGVGPQECIALEDSEVGVQSALAFGSQVWRLNPF